MVKPSPKRRLLRYGAFLPAVILGTWLVVYTQRQAAKPLDVPVSFGRLENLTADTLIDLNLAPEVVEFEGFINYGEPIHSLTPHVIRSPHVIRVTSKRIEMPIFNTRDLRSLLLAQPGSEMRTGRKGWEQHVADLIDGSWGNSVTRSSAEDLLPSDPFSP